MLPEPRVSVCGVWGVMGIQQAGGLLRGSVGDCVCFMSCSHGEDFQLASLSPRLRAVTRETHRLLCA